MHDQDTIAAISSPAGNGAIAMIRLSGPESFTIANKIFTGKRSIREQKHSSLQFGRIQKNEETIDEVMLSKFEAPNSYTGEKSIEISCHGSLYIQRTILELLIDKGARLAAPGEFTQRAFLNGKMDLSQAEAVADLIASENRASHNLAMNQLRGGFAKALRELRERLLNFVSLIELELDFSEEDVEFANRDELNKLVEEVIDHLKKLLDSFQLGNVIKNGVPVAIAGHTNVGKSTLLNALFQEERAIVSEIAGTTRDYIEGQLNIGGFGFRFIDTAGIRLTQDVIESLGIARTFAKIEEASIVLFMVGANDPENTILESIKALKERLKPKRQELIVLLNKIDLEVKAKIEGAEKHLKKEFPAAPVLQISAKEETHLEELKTLLVEKAHLNQESSQVIVSNARHYQALRHALEAMKRVNEGLQSGLSSDFIAQDIRECLHHLGEITGQISTDEILGNIFKNFCIGK